MSPAAAEQREGVGPGLPGPVQIEAHEHQRRVRVAQNPEPLLRAIAHRALVIVKAQLQAAVRRFAPDTVERAVLGPGIIVRQRAEVAEGVQDEFLRLQRLAQVEHLDGGGDHLFCNLRGIEQPAAVAHRERRD